MSKYAQGRALYHLQRYGEARAAFFQVDVHDPMHCDALVLVAWSYYLEDDVENALRASEYVLGQYPEASEALAIYGISLCLAGSWLQGMDMLDRAIALDPGKAHSYYLKSYYLNHAKQYEKALAYIDEALRRSPSHASYLRLRSIILGHMGRTDEAKEASQLALRADPESSEGHEQYGKVLLFEGRTEESIHSLREALRSDPTNKRARKAFLQAHRHRFPLYRTLEQFERKVLGLKPPWNVALFVGPIMICSFTEGISALHHVPMALMGLFFAAILFYVLFRTLVRFLVDVKIIYRSDMSAFVNRQRRSGLMLGLAWLGIGLVGEAVGIALRSGVTMYISLLPTVVGAVIAGANSILT